jgi:hypothetical protein
VAYTTVYTVCDQNDPVDTTAWKQQHNIQYEDKDEDEDGTRHTSENISTQTNSSRFGILLSRVKKQRT